MKKSLKKQKPFITKKKLLIFVLIVFSGFLIWNTEPQKRYAKYFNKFDDIIFGTIQIIEIKGNSVLSRNEILNYVYKENITPDDLNIVKSPSEIKRELMKNPLIEFASVKSFLPNKMVIYIIEKRLILKFWNAEKQKFFSITEKGEIINFYRSNINIPSISGDFDLKQILELYNNFKTYDMVHLLSEIIPFFNYRFDVVLNKTTLVRLPENNTKKAIEILSNLVREQNILSKNIKQIDLRIQGKVIVSYFEKNEPKTYKTNSSYTVLSW
jgi:cell division septal protein FtsQ